VSEADNVLFGREELERAFTALGERLVRSGIVADIFIVGGAAMALAYDAARVTRDVDGGLTSRQVPTSLARRTRHGRLPHHIFAMKARGQNARHRRSSPTRRHRRGGISRRRPPDMRGLLPR